MIISIFKKKQVHNLIFFFLVFILFGCDITKDADCEKQKSNENKCLRAFLLFCSGNRTLVQCDGQLESILTIGTVCKVGVECKSNTDDVVSEKVKFGIKNENTKE